MTYETFLKNLNARGMFRIHPSLDRVRDVLRALGNPQDRFPAIHIAGTNGKGSVAAALESVLRANGYRTGLYTSPHLIDLRERVKIGGLPLTHAFVALAEDVLKAEQRVKAPLTYFELLTAIAFHSFAKRKVDIGIIECGLGGQWDATNVLQNPLASIITSVGLDHTEWLGADEFQIAAQKAGIIKPRGHVISGVSGPGRGAIIRAARDNDAKIEQIDTDFKAESLTVSWRSGKQTLRFLYKGESARIVPFGLLGRHQVDNAALVLTAIHRLRRLGWTIAGPKQDQGLRDVHWPGRMQLIHRPNSASLLIDGAHNPPAMKELLQTIESSPFKNMSKTFVFSAFKDKDMMVLGGMITRLAAEVCLCPLPGPRAASLKQLRNGFLGVRGPVRTFKSPREALVSALRDTPRDGLVVVTGSLALVGEILKQTAVNGRGGQRGRRLTGTSAIGSPIKKDTHSPKFPLTDGPVNRRSRRPPLSSKVFSHG